MMRWGCAHWVPVERDADPGFLRAGLYPTSARERQYLSRNSTLDENGIGTRGRKGRKKGGTICEKRAPIRSMDTTAR